MKTNKPEVKAWIISTYVPYSGFHRHVCMSEDDVHVSRATFERLNGEVEEVHLINLSDYEALQAECEKLEKDAERYRWLRDGNDEEDSEAIHIAVHYYGDMWDEMIDIAMGEESK